MIQIIKCKCGVVFAGCVEPLCYTEKDWTDNLKYYIEERGCKIEMVDSNSNLQFQRCKCNENKHIQLTLF